jgi:hypothetical protein
VTEAGSLLLIFGTLFISILVSFSIAALTVAVSRRTTQ